MKKIIYSLAAMACIAMAACRPEPIQEDKVFLSETDVQKIVSDDGGTLYTLHAFVDKYMSEEGNYLSDTALYRQRATNGDGIYLFSIDTLPSNGPGIYIRGRVTTDDLGGNFYKSMVIQQMVDGKQQTLRISIDGSSVNGMYPMGQEILIRCNGLAIGRYANQNQLCVPSYNNNFTAQYGSEKIGWAPGRIPYEKFQLITQRIGKPDMSLLHYDEVQISDFITNLDQKAVRKIDGKLVRIKNIHFTGQYSNYGDPATCTTGSPLKDQNCNVFAPTTNGLGFPQGRIIADGAGKMTLISTSEYAKFANFYLPDSEYWGEVTGILSYYRDNATKKIYNGTDSNAPAWDDWAVTLRDIESSSRFSLVNDLHLKNAAGEAWVPVEYSSK